MTEFVVDLDENKVSALMRIWRLESPKQLIEALFNWTYHSYVEEEDELVSGKAARRKTEELEMQLERMRKRSDVKQDPRKTALCPVCFNKVVFDEVDHVFSCAVCGWQGPGDKVVRRSDAQ